MSTVVKYWRSLDQDMAMAYSLGEPFELDLPSGRSMRYGKLKRMKELGGMNRFRYIGKLVRNGQMRDFAIWGGVLTENCVAHDSEVLTQDKGWTRIADVNRDQLVWDGIEFVAHSGFLDKGEQSIINIFGVDATADHRFLVGKEWVPAEKACLLPIGEVASPPYEAQGVYGTDIWDLHSIAAGGIYKELQRNRTWDESPLGTPVSLRTQDNSDIKRNKKKQNMREGLSDLIRSHSAGSNDTRINEAQTICCMEVDERQMQTTVAPSMGQLRGSRDRSMPKMAEELPELLGRHESYVDSRTHTRSDRQQQGISTGELPMGDLLAAGEEHSQFQSSVGDIRLSESQWGQERHSSLPSREWVAPSNCGNNKTKLFKQVGDLLNCGPRNRFALRAGKGYPVLIAHNCAQGLARDIFSDMMIRVDAAGYPVILHVHDELVCEVPEGDAEKALAEILAIMHTPPSWIPDIPVAAEGHILDLYSK